MTRWDGEAALAPLRDREGWNVVGAVRVPRARLAIRWLEWGLPALLLIALVFAAFSARLMGGPALQERALAAYAAAALVAGCAAYIDVRTAAKRATDRWLAETGALVQEVTTHASGRVDPADIASIVRGGTLVPAGIAGWDSKPRRMNRGAVASIVVRIGAGRWAELRTRAAEAATGVWFICIFCLALLGPAAVRITARGDR
jgi:multisubunit Na+/H+ antiporter MnhF subunit